MDGFAKNPISALRCIPRGLRRLEPGLFSFAILFPLPSFFLCHLGSWTDLLREHQYYVSVPFSNLNPKPGMKKRFGERAAFRQAAGILPVHFRKLRDCPCNRA
jgi:hypothetical protein